MNDPGQGPRDRRETNTPSDSLSNDGKRRKPALNGRGVSTLSKEALDKKRDNDRKAQAAIRKRQKDEVANLKLQIQVLNSQKPYLELKSVIEEKNAVRDENEKLRAALKSVMDTIQPFVAPAMQDLAAIAHHNAQAALKSRSFDPNMPYPTTDHAGYRSSSPFHSSDQDANGESPALASQRPALNDQREMVQRHHQLNKNESLDFRFLVDMRYTNKLGQEPSPSERRHSLSMHSAPPSVMGDHESHQPWNILPLISAPDTPLDKLLTDFIRDHRQPSTSSVPSVYPTNPSILNLLNPLESTASSSSETPDLSRHMQDTVASNTSHFPDALSNYMTKLVMWFDGLTGLPEKVGVCYIMYGVLRWQTYPTKENYYLVPEMMRPCGAQLNVRHPAWFDHLPWPEMRDKMIRGRHDDYRFSKTWFEAFTEGLSVNWPFSETTCLAGTGKNGQEEISPAFLEHISRLESWTLGSQFFNAFPELRGTAPIKDRNPDASTSYSQNARTLQGAKDATLDAISAAQRRMYEYGRQDHGSSVGRYDTNG